MHEELRGEWRYSSAILISSAIDEGKWLASRSCHIIPVDRDPGKSQIGDWYVFKAGLDAEKRRIDCPCTECTPGSSVVKPVAYYCGV
jgi:hypothetical protein